MIRTRDRLPTMADCCPNGLVVSYANGGGFALVEYHDVCQEKHLAWDFLPRVDESPVTHLQRALYMFQNCDVAGLTVSERLLAERCAERLFHLCRWTR